MADRTREIDKLIKDFLRGKIDIKIKARRMWLLRYVPTENNGANKVKNNTSPQEWYVLKNEALDEGQDKELAELEYQKEILTMLWECESSETKQIVSLKLKDERRWYQVAQSLFISERTAQQRYYDFRDTVSEMLT
ncbi:hypothetical protein BM86_11780 [Bacillus thuringiensis]|uniref:DUF722 domain-containing protein n=1 Tax=Bacillus thuringiensis TaxID=1428 RepID=A0A9W3WZW9_BACTU|nr:DUF722 domain-containing protein [Bacillus thuringiensis]ANS47595.1 hypothetical protein BT246_22210 [Bacillus thuringiensis]MBH0336154.1 hypothetical protein [Bacillus thuringiensis]